MLEIEKYLEIQEVNIHHDANCTNKHGRLVNKHILYTYHTQISVQQQAW
jgi:hypothetical protein